VVIFGVDIASGSPHSRRPPSFALFIMNGQAVATYPLISRHKLIRLIRERQPEIVAMDNVYELAGEKLELISLLRRLPPATRLVQVTGGDKPEALTRVARWNGISFDRQNPLEEAEACARLAARGVGSVLSAFEDRTWIKVSRRRSPGRGGWSQNRYSRKIHGAVKGLAREVEKQLRESGHDFTSRTTEGLGGYTRAEFFVDAPRESVHINSGYFCDAQIRIEGVERPRLQFKPLLHRRGYIIVGLDPGTTTGIAALNLGGELIDLVSAREMATSDVIEWIAARGRPLIVATDVSPTPGAVEKVKRAFNAVIYSPGMDVSAEEKIALAKEYGYKNDHERDALAAASSAFKRYKNKFIQVDRKVPEDTDPEEVKALVVKGYAIENAISEFIQIPKAKKKDEAEQEPVDPNPVIESLRSQTLQQSEQIRTLRSYLDELKIELAGKDDEVAKAVAKMERQKEKSFRKIKRDHEIKIRDKEIERLRGLLRSERRYIKKLKQDLGSKKKAERIEEIKGFRRIKTVEAFSRDAILAAEERWGIDKGDIVLIVDASGGGPNTADLLIEKMIEAVIIESDMSNSILEHFNGKGLPVFSADEVQVQKIDGIAFVDPKEVAMAKERWAEQMKAQAAHAKAEWLETMIRDYRVERKKEEQKKRESKDS
jgi:predicted RNase H-like nuclease (RuvC/YqgF family)